MLTALGALTVVVHTSCSGVDDSRDALAPTCIDDDCGRLGEVPSGSSAGGVAGVGATGGQLGFAGIPGVGGGLGVPVPGSPPVDAGVDQALGAPVETTTGGQPAVDTPAAATASLGVPVPGAPPVDAGVTQVLGTPAETLTGGQPGTAAVATGGTLGVAASVGGTGGVLDGAQADPVESTF